MVRDRCDLAVVGGGAAGYFAALRAVALNPRLTVIVFESGRRPLEKVRISGGGRCNVTHHCFEPKALTANYPRGARELFQAFHRFQPEDTVAWFTERGVSLKVEPDGRMFPRTDSSETIVKCLEDERQRLGIKLHTSSRVERVERLSAGGFALSVHDATGTGVSHVHADRLLLASGSHKSGHQFAQELGHSITPLAPSLFTFKVSDAQLCDLAGVSVPHVWMSLRIDDQEIAASEGPLLVTHWGLSGPAVLKLSAWAARELLEANYRAELVLNWTADQDPEHCRSNIRGIRAAHSKKSVVNTPLYEVPTRLWELLVRRALGNGAEKPWHQLSNEMLEGMVKVLMASRIRIDGKGQFKEEFVTCGGVNLKEIDFRTMQSKCTPGLYVCGELLDVDGVTGGFNFQSAWTTGWIAGTAVAADSESKILP